MSRSTFIQKPVQQLIKLIDKRGRPCCLLVSGNNETKARVTSYLLRILPEYDNAPCLILSITRSDAEPRDILSASVSLTSTYVTHHKSKAFLQVNISDASVSLEEPLHILLSGRRAETADEYPTATHVDVMISANRSK